MVYAFSYGGLVFDLLVMPLILWQASWIVPFGQRVFPHTFAKQQSDGVTVWKRAHSTNAFGPSQ